MAIPRGIPADQGRVHRRFGFRVSHSVPDVRLHVTDCFLHGRVLHIAGSSTSPGDTRKEGEELMVPVVTVFRIPHAGGRAAIWSASKP